MNPVYTEKPSAVGFLIGVFVTRASAFGQAYDWGGIRSDKLVTSGKNVP